MKRYIAAVLLFLAIFLCACTDPYVDPDTGRMDKEAFAKDALDEVLPEIIENISDEQIEELMEDDRCKTAMLIALSDDDIKQLALERLNNDKKYCEYDEARDLILYMTGYSEAGEGWADNLSPLYFSEVIEQAD